MASSAMMGSGADRNARWGGLVGIVTGILGIGVFVGFGLLPTGTTVQILANFSTYRNQLLYTQVVVGLFSAFLVSFAVALRNALKSKDAYASTAAAALVAAGGIVLAILINLQISEMSTLAGIYAAGDGPTQTAAVVMASAMLFGVSGPFNVSSLLIGFGIIGLGFVMVNSKTFPNWVGYVGILAGIPNLIGLIPAGFLILILTGVWLILSHTVWVFASAAYLWRSAMPAAGRGIPSPG